MFLILSVIGFVIEDLNYYKLNLNIIDSQNRSEFYVRKKLYNLNIIFNELFSLYVILVIIKNYKTSIINYTEIFTILIYILNYLGFKILNIFLNVNIYLNLC